MIDEVADDLNLVLLKREPLSGGSKQRYKVALLFAAMIVTAITGLLPIYLAATGTAVLMVATGCLNVQQAYRAVPWSVIVLLGAMAGVATAVQYSGLTTVAVSGILNTVGHNPLIVMGVLYIMSCVITSLVTPPATILIIGPLVQGLALGLNVDPRPLLIILTLGVSCTFLTPFGHQSNVLVFSVGGYSFKDYFRVGWPLCLLIMIVSLLIIPVFWSF